MAISKLQNGCPNTFLGTQDGLGTLHCTQKIIITNYLVIKSPKMELKCAKIFKNDHFEGHFWAILGAIFRPL